MSTLNVNVGILGHVDSGKTSLARAVSTHFSTASLDKSQQSRERGITLDLGFSSFTTDVPAHLADSGYDKLQFTFVDCPGHASLIRTIMGGAGIIDMMVLVINVAKGVQTQTAECLVIGEILTDHLIVVLNKVDLIPKAKRKEKIDKLVKKLRSKVFKTTKFGENVTIVCATANPGGTPPESVALTEDHEVVEKAESADVSEFTKALLSEVKLPDRSGKGDFLYAVDHCFVIKGKGSVMTGTVLAGAIKVNDMVEIPALKVERKVKSLQMFHKPAQSARQGDRVGMLVQKLDMERGLVATPGSVQTFDGAIAQIEKIRFFKEKCKSKSKLHITIGHTTVLATLTFFAIPTEQEQLDHASKKSSATPMEEVKSDGDNSESLTFNFDRDYLSLDEIQKKRPKGTQFVLLNLERPVTAPRQARVIGSKLDKEITTSDCRLAFHGQLITPFDCKDPKNLQQLRVYTPKCREGSVDRIHDANTLIGRDLFRKETDLTIFTGMTVHLETGEVGKIIGGFGKSGKFKMSFPSGLDAFTAHVEAANPPSEADKDAASVEKKGRKKKAQKTIKCKVYLKFKKYVYAEDRKLMVQ